MAIGPATAQKYCQTCYPHNDNELMARAAARGGGDLS